jgi:DNA-directed RNA polymerase I subunit RPA12
MLSEGEYLNDFNKIFSRPPNFCEECGEMLNFEIILNDEVQCQKCGAEKNLDEITNHQVETVNFYHNSKDWVNKLANIEDKFKKHQSLKRQTVQEKCPSCPSNKMYFYTMQTRSADEGSTVFYQCVKCGALKKENN